MATIESTNESFPPISAQLQKNNMVLLLDDLAKRIQMFVAQNDSYTIQDLINYLNTNVAFVQVQSVPKMEDVFNQDTLNTIHERLQSIQTGVSLAVWCVFLMTRKSFGIPYLWPLIPFKWKNGMDNVLLRKPFSNIHGRPGILHPKIQKRDG